MLDFTKALKVKSSAQDYYVFKEPVKVDFPSFKDESKKRKRLADVICRELERSGQAFGVIGYGSSYYGKARKDSDLDLVGLSGFNRPFKAYFKVQNRKGEPVEVNFRGYVPGKPTISFTGRKRLGKLISGKLGLWSLTYPLLFRKAKSSPYAKYSTLDALDILRRILHDARSNGIKEMTPGQVLESYLGLERKLNQRFFEKPRLRKGLIKIIRKNISSGLHALEGRLIARKRGKWLILDRVLELRKEPLDLSLSEKRDTEVVFRRNNIKPLIKRVWNEA